MITSGGPSRENQRRHRGRRHYHLRHHHHHHHHYCEQQGAASRSGGGGGLNLLGGGAKTWAKQVDEASPSSAMESSSSNIYNRMGRSQHHHHNHHTHIEHQHERCTYSIDHNRQHSIITAKGGPQVSQGATQLALKRGLVGARRRAGPSSQSSGGRGGGGVSKLEFIAMKLALATMALIILVALTSEVHSLNCYTCSSADDPACDEPFTGRANFTGDTDCEKHIGRPAKVCRKIVQYIEEKKVVIRSCGWIDERDANNNNNNNNNKKNNNNNNDDKTNEKKSMCYKRSGTFALMMESCVCYEDNCNHSASLVPNQSVLLTLLTACSIVYLYLGKGRAPDEVGARML